MGSDCSIVVENMILDKKVRGSNLSSLFLSFHYRLTFLDHVPQIWFISIFNMEAMKGYQDMLPEGNQLNLHRIGKIRPKFAIIF